MGHYSTIDSCAGCSHEEGYGAHEKSYDGAICKMYDRPASKWRVLGGCPSATHRVTAPLLAVKARVGQQKQKKSK